MNLLSLVQERIRPAIAALADDPEPYVGMVKATQDAKHGDYQANCAMSLAKKLGQKPRDTAQAIADKIDLGGMLEKPEIAGPGFINLRLRADWMAARLQEMAKDERLGVAQAEKPQTIVIDYSAPNVAKPMHVGHLRSTIIGESICRLLRFLGHKVIGDNHLGDWGTQMGMILWGWKNHLDEKAYAEHPINELARLYRLAISKIKNYETWGKDWGKILALEAAGKNTDAEGLFVKLFPGKDRKELEAKIQEGKTIDAASRAETAKLHQGDPENRRLWQDFMPHCLSGLKKIYERLDVHFDYWLGESAYDAVLSDIAADLERRGLAVSSEGAKVVFVEGMSAPFMIQKSDGAFNYATSDLATIKYRHEHFQPDLLLYVVDHRQGDHFKALFAVAKLWGYQTPMRHLAFGTVMGSDGKPFKAREGDTVGLESLLDEAAARARKVVDENSPELSETERAAVAEIVGMGAVKYADLSQNRTSNYVFDFDKMVKTDGNTGTYMQYAFARNRSIFRKGEVDPASLRANPPLPQLETAPERALALMILRLDETLQATTADYQPSIITAYLWDLAKTYSGFFHDCPVLKAETPELRQSRLLLCDLTARVLQLCLHLLGIKTAERM